MLLESVLVASRDDGAVFFTAAKTNKGSVRWGSLLTLRGFVLRARDMILFQYRVRRNEQTVRVCAVYASLIPIRSKAYPLPSLPNLKNCLDIQMKRFTPKPSPPLFPLPSLTQKRVNIVPNNEEFPMHDASTTLSCVVSAAVPHVPDVRTITRFSKCSID